MKKFIALLSCMLFILGSIGTVFADENTTVAGSCEFTGKEMVSSFDSNKIAASVSQMEPGDSVTFSVDIKNNSSISTILIYSYICRTGWKRGHYIQQHQRRW